MTTYTYNTGLAALMVPLLGEPLGHITIPPGMQSTVKDLLNSELGAKKIDLYRRNGRVYLTKSVPGESTLLDN